MSRAGHTTERMSADAVLPCACCGKPAAHLGVFYLARLDMGVVDHDALRRQAGLEQMIGHAGIAGVLGSRDVIGRVRYGTGEAHVCATCMAEVTLTDLMNFMADDGVSSETGEDHA